MKSSIIYLKKIKPTSAGKRNQHRFEVDRAWRHKTKNYSKINSNNEIFSELGHLITNSLSSLVKTKTNRKFDGIYSCFKNLAWFKLPLSTDTLTVSSALKMRIKLKKIPLGHPFSYVSNRYGFKASFCRCAGTSAQIVDYSLNGEPIVRLPSGTKVRFSSNSFANLGSVINLNYKKARVGKAGSNIHRNKKPHTRGIAKNPVDHAHGGRTNGGRGSRTPLGLITKGPKTKKNKTKIIQKNYIII